MNFVFTFEPSDGEVYEYYSLRIARKKAIEMAKERNQEIMVTKFSYQGGKQSWFTAYPDGRFEIDGLNLSFNN